MRISSDHAQQKSQPSSTACWVRSACWFSPYLPCFLCFHAAMSLELQRLPSSLCCQAGEYAHWVMGVSPG